VDREALKAELRAELLAEMRAMHPAQQTANPTPPSVIEPVEVAVVDPDPLKDEVRVPPVVPSVEKEEPAPADDSEPAEPPPPPAPVEVEPAVVPITTAEVQPEIPPHPSLAVVRLDVATGVNRELREPENVGKTFSLATTSILYAYIAVQNKGNPAEVVVEWYRAGTRRSHITLNVGHSIRGWRTWSKVRLGSKDSGPWEVHVLDGKGHLLHRAAFEVRP